MSELAKTIGRFRDEIISEFVSRAREALADHHHSPVELRDHLPSYLSELEQALNESQQPSRASGPKETAREHGRQRFRAGFPLSALVREFGILRQCILDIAERERISLSISEVAAFSRYLEQAVAEGVNEHDEGEHGARLAQEEQQRRALEALFEATPVGLGVVRGPEHRFELANAVLRTAAQRPLIGRTAREVFPEPGAQPFLALLDRVLATGEAQVSNELPIAVAGEDTRRFNFTYQPLRGADEAVVGVIILSVDVTELVRARMRSEFEAAELGAVLQSISDGVYVGDATGIKRVNRAGLEQLGYRRDEDLTSRSIAEAAEDIQTRNAETGAIMRAEDQPFSRALGGVSEVREVLIRHIPTGVDRVVRSSCAPIVVAGKIVGAVAVNTDITELTRKRDFERHLVGIVSHDLRNPLGVISITAGMAQRTPGITAALADHFTRIQRATDQCIRLISDLLDFTRARLGQGIPVDRNPAKLAPTLRQVVEDLRHTFPGREVELSIDGEGEGFWDLDRLGQVFENLLTNALKYGRASAPVRVQLEARGEQISLTVRNEGAPIPHEQLSTLFQPLQRTSPDFATRSVGLGLFIVKSIAEAHGGTVSVHSTAAEGTAFTVRLSRFKEPGYARAP